MAENKEYFTSTSDRGNVKISEDVISTIVSVAVLETEGAAAITTGITQDIAGLIGKKAKNIAPKKGVRVNFAYDDVEIEIDCQVIFGSSVFEIAMKIQENVKAAVESMTGLKCKTVDVNITGVTFEKE